MRGPRSPFVNARSVFCGGRIVPERSGLRVSRTRIAGRRSLEGVARGRTRSGRRDRGRRGGKGPRGEESRSPGTRASYITAPQAPSVHEVTLQEAKQELLYVLPSQPHTGS